MSRELKDQVGECLREIIDPCSAANGTNFNVIQMGLLRDIDVSDGHVTVRYRLTSPGCLLAVHFMKQTEELVGALPDVRSVTVEIDNGLQWDAGMMDRESRERYIEGLRRGMGRDLQRRGVDFPPLKMVPAL